MSSGDCCWVLTSELKWIVKFIQKIEEMSVLIFYWEKYAGPNIWNIRKHFINGGTLCNAAMVCTKTIENRHRLQSCLFLSFFLRNLFLNAWREYFDNVSTHAARRKIYWKIWSQTCKIADCWWCSGSFTCGEDFSFSYPLLLHVIFSSSMTVQIFLCKFEYWWTFYCLNIVFHYLHLCYFSYLFPMNSFTASYNLIEICKVVGIFWSLCSLMVMALQMVDGDSWCNPWPCE